MSFSPPPNTPPSSGGVLINKEAKEEPEQINCNEEENTTIIQNQSNKFNKIRILNKHEVESNQNSNKTSFIKSEFNKNRV